MFPLHLLLSVTAFHLVFPLLQLPLQPAPTPGLSKHCCNPYSHLLISTGTQQETLATTTKCNKGSSKEVQTQSFSHLGTRRGCLEKLNLPFLEEFQKQQSFPTTAAGSATGSQIKENTAQFIQDAGNLPDSQAAK